MEIQRCPECGGRLRTNYCDVCMKRVPFRGIALQTRKDPWDFSSAHREEAGHTCVSFDAAQPKPKAKPLRKATLPKMKKPAAGNILKVKAVIIVIAALSVLSALFGIVEEVTEVAPMPDYNYEAFVEEDVPQITAGEIYNDGEIIVTADGAGAYYGDYTVVFTVQNDSDRDVTVSTQLLSVNGYMADFGMSAHVVSGENRQVLMQLYHYELEEMGITEIAQIAFCLNIYDSKSYEDIATSPLITLDTDIGQAYQQPVDDAGWEMHIDENLRIVYRGATFSEYGDCDLHLYLENLSDGNVSFSTDGIWINGEEVSGFVWDTLRPDTRSVNSLYIYDLDDMDITQFSQITDVYIEYRVDSYRGDEITQTVYCTVSFNPNDLPKGE